MVGKHRKAKGLLPMNASVLVICAFMMLIMGSKGDQCSSAVLKSTKTCQICMHLSSFLNCTLSSQSGSTTQLSQPDCIAICCNASETSTSKVPLCQKQQPSLYQSSSDIQVSTFLLIIFFAIPGLLCVYCTASYCCRKRRQMLEREAAGQQINLEDYDMNKMGPYFIQTDQNCSICLEDKCNIITKCSHLYHYECLQAWVKKMKKCPLCVSTQINPIIQYCFRCFRSVKLVIIKSEVEAVGQHAVCNGCRTENQRENCEISINLEEENDNEKKQKEANDFPAESSNNFVLR